MKEPPCQTSDVHNIVSSVNQLFSYVFIRGMDRLECTSSYKNMLPIDWPVSKHEQIRWTRPAARRHVRLASSSEPRWTKVEGEFWGEGDEVGATTVKNTTLPVYFLGGFGYLKLSAVSHKENAWGSTRCPKRISGLGVYQPNWRILRQVSASLHHSDHITSKWRHEPGRKTMFFVPFFFKQQLRILVTLN